MYDQQGDETPLSELADNFTASDPYYTTPTRTLGTAEIKRLHRVAGLKARGKKKARIWQRSDIVVIIAPPTHEELREMVGCVDHDEAARQRRVSLLESGIRRRQPSLTNGQLDAAIARVARALSPPSPPSDSDWEAIRRRRVIRPALAAIPMVPSVF